MVKTKWSRINVRKVNMKTKEIVNRIFSKVLESVDPQYIVKAYYEKIRSYYLMRNFRNIIVIGFGKASYQMAKAVEEVFETDLIEGGAIVTKYGHTEKHPSAISGERSEDSDQRSAVSGQSSKDLKKIKVYEAGHPIPDENGIKATEKIIKLLQNTDENTLVLCLVSGGGSALFISPYEGITLKEKQEITDLLLRAGADITDLNAARKHLSKVKGGRLAEIVYPAEIISLMISDVIGDKLDVIASGPTAPDLSTYQDALDVIDKYGLAEKAPARIIDLLHRGAKGFIADTPKKESPVFEKVQNIIIGSNGIAIEAAKKEAESLGFKAEIVSTEVEGEAREVGKWMAEKAKEIKGTGAHGHKGTKCLISGGETTVHVKGTGKGGRNTELALSFAMEVEGLEGITMLSAGTDGTDGPTDAAGAVVDGTTVTVAKDLGLNPQEYLDNNDSYNFFKKVDSLLITGPTGTNVMDVQIVVIE
jgi:glycerate-2-kinase